jgi:beta-glucanase (GH16 family)
MVRRKMLSLLFVTMLALCLCPDRAGAYPPMVGGVGVFDTFDGPAGAPPNQQLWDASSAPYHDAGLQTYTDSPQNVSLDGDGHLMIQARKTPSGYTSARVVTRGKLAMQYGSVSARIKFPQGQGIWPAFWLLGADYDRVGWPRAGEIDIMEIVNSANTYNVTLHGPQGATDYYGGTDGSQVVGNSGPVANLSDDFHEYWLDWRPDSITVGIDGVTVASFSPSSLPKGAEWVFNKPMFAVLNLAVGGPWPGPPDSTTRFPATMLVDWFRYVPAS